MERKRDNGKRTKSEQKIWERERENQDLREERDFRRVVFSDCQLIKNCSLTPSLINKAL